MGLKVKEINKGTLATFSEAARAKILEETKKTSTKASSKFSMEQVRNNAFKIMGALAHLSQKERQRVLTQAVKLNKI